MTARWVITSTCRTIWKARRSTSQPDSGLQLQVPDPEGPVVPQEEGGGLVQIVAVGHQDIGSQPVRAHVHPQGTLVVQLGRPVQGEVQAAPSVPETVGGTPAGQDRMLPVHALFAHEAEGTVLEIFVDASIEDGSEGIIVLELVSGEESVLVTLGRAPLQVGPQAAGGLAELGQTGLEIPFVYPVGGKAVGLRILVEALPFHLGGERELRGLVSEAERSLSQVMPEGVDGLSVFIPKEDLPVAARQVQGAGPMAGSFPGILRTGSLRAEGQQEGQNKGGGAENLVFHNGQQEGLRPSCAVGS